MNAKILFFFTFLSSQFFTTYSQNYDTTLVVTCKIGAKLKLLPDSKGDILKLFSTEEKGIVTDYNLGYLEICFDTICGYMNDLWIKETDFIEKFNERKKIYDQIAKDRKEEIKKWEDEKLNDNQEMNIARTKQLQRNREEMEKRFLEKYGTETYLRLKSEKFWIGMKDEMTRFSLGEPIKINSSVGSWGIHEQWVYKDLYLYFENGILTSYQN